jgi:phosphoglycolate phosphatase-like HAD superfamily hydrolase
MTNLFVWDFHGVLEKGNEYAVQEVVNKVLKEYGYEKTVTIEEIKFLAGRSWAGHYTYFFRDIPKEKLASMVDRSNSLGLRTAPKYVQPNDYVVFVLGKIREKGCSSIVVSHVQKEAAKFFTDLVGIGKLIDGFFATDTTDDSIIVQTKKAAIKSYMEGKKFDKVVLIGDSEHDIEAGIAIGAVTYLYSKNVKRAERTKADHVISDLRDVLREL